MLRYSCFGQIHLSVLISRLSVHLCRATYVGVTRGCPEKTALPVAETACFQPYPMLRKVVPYKGVPLDQEIYSSSLFSKANSPGRRPFSLHCESYWLRKVKGSFDWKRRKGLFWVTGAATGRGPGEAGPEVALEAQRPRREGRDWERVEWGTENTANLAVKLCTSSCPTQMCRWHSGKTETQNPKGSTLPLPRPPALLAVLTSRLCDWSEKITPVLGAGSFFPRMKHLKG